MEKEWIPLKEASAQLNISYETLKKHVQRGKYQSKLINNRTHIHIEAPQESSEDFTSKWLKDLASGVHSGKPATAKSCQNYKDTMKAYSRHLGIEGMPKVSDITPSNLETVLAASASYRPNNRDSYARRIKLYQAYISYSKWLIKHRYKPEGFLQVLPPRPKRQMQAVRHVITSGDLKALLFENDLMGGRDVKGFDRALGRVCLMLLCFAGLRVNELVNLRAEDVDLREKEIFVFAGKGGKHRTIGIIPVLLKELEAWEKFRDKGASTYIHTRLGAKPFKADGIKIKIRRISQQAGVKASPHSFRRYFATFLASKGVPIDQIQMLLGHADIKTTMSYIRTDERTAVNSLKRLDL